MGDAHHAIAGELQGGIALAVVLERLACAVVSVSIQLDHQPALVPHHVDHDARDEHVHLGPRKAGVAAEREEAALELGASGGRGALPVADDRLQAAEPAVPFAAVDQPLNGSKVEYLQALRLIERPPEATPLHDLGQIEQRTRKAGDRDAVLHCAILGDEPPRPV
jgi:hypothetical protein